MSLMSDVYESCKDYAPLYRLKHFLSPREWYYHHKWRKQRLSRGWSNRDAWGAGEYIAKVTAEMLQYLNDGKYTDWDEWFDLNVKEEGKGAYKDLQSVIDDINNFLVHSETSWADGLTTTGFRKEDEGHYKSEWFDEITGKKLTEAAVSYRINKWSKENNRLYGKAKKAMGFFGRHFAGFWD